MTSWPWTLMVNGISSLQPKACTFVFCQFTLNPRDAASLAIVSNMGTTSSSSSAKRETSSAKSRSVKELWTNATPIEHDSTVLSSNQSMPVANESGASTQPWQTPASILNHEMWVPPVRTQLTELSYSTFKFGSPLLSLEWVKIDTSRYVLVNDLTLVGHAHMTHF